MAEALYRTWRPETFQDVVGQEHITTTLVNQIASNRIGHAYLFVGSRGCGKTTTARILAKEINSIGMDAKRAQQIAEAVREGRALDVIEIDAASHTGVDAMRDVIERAAFQPNEFTYKVYIIDEVHMLSIAAFNALLKTLEEPPPHVVFILATTDPQKIPATVLSRCQRFNFKRVPVALMKTRLRVICEKEGFDVDEHALQLIARQATGSLRDAISLLDQLASSNSLRITADDVREALGATDSASVKALMDSLTTRNPAQGLDAIQTAIDQGADARQLARQMVDYLRSTLQAKVTSGAPQKAAETSEEQLDQANYAKGAGTWLLLRAIRAFSTAINEMRSSVDAQLFLELALLECIAAEEQPAPAPAEAPARSDSAPRAEPAPRATETRTAQASATPAQTEPVREARKVGETSIETLRAQWKQLIQDVNTNNKPTAALLRSCHPQSVDDDVVRIRADHDLIRQRLEDPKHRGVMTAALNQLLKGQFIVQVFTTQTDQSNNTEDDPLVKTAKKLGGKVRAD